MKEGEYAQMVPLLERAITEGLFTPEELLQIGRVCMQIPDMPHAPSAKVAFSAALQRMRSQTEPPPRVDKLAEVMFGNYESPCLTCCSPHFVAERNLSSII